MQHEVQRNDVQRLDHDRFWIPWSAPVSATDLIQCSFQRRKVLCVGASVKQSFEGALRLVSAGQTKPSSVKLPGFGTANLPEAEAEADEDRCCCPAF